MRDDYDWKAWWPWAKKNPLTSPEFTPEEIAEMSEATYDVVELVTPEERMEWIEEVALDILGEDIDVDETFDVQYFFGTSLEGIDNPRTLKLLILWLMWHRRTQW